MRGLSGSQQHERMFVVRGLAPSVNEQPTRDRLVGHEIARVTADHGSRVNFHVADRSEGNRHDRLSSSDEDMRGVRTPSDRADIPYCTLSSFKSF